MSKKIKGISLIIFSSMFFGSYGAFSKLLSQYFDVFYQGAIRGLIILILILPFLIYKKGIIKIEKQDRKWFLIFIISTSATQAPLYFAFKYLDVGIGSLLFFVSMLLTMYIYGFLFLEEKFNKIKIISFILAILGMFIIFPLDFKNIIFFATILMIINGIASGIEVSSSKKLSGNYSGLYLSSIGWLSVFLTNIFIAILLGENLILPKFNLEWFYLFLYALASLFGFWFVIEGLKYIEASLGGLLGLLEIIFAIIFGILFFNEILTLNTIVGGTLILISAGLPYLVIKKSNNL